MKIKGGYILTARKTLDSDLMDKPPLCWKLWNWLLLKARRKPNGALRRGQVHTTISEMQKAMSWLVGFRRETPSKDQMRSSYEALVKAAMITTMKTTRGMIIEVRNYSFYQNPENYEARNEPRNEDTTKPPRSPHLSLEGRMEEEEKEFLSPIPSVEETSSSDVKPEPKALSNGLKNDPVKFEIQAKDGPVEIREDQVREWQAKYPKADPEAVLRQIRDWYQAMKSGQAQDTRVIRAGLIGYIDGWLKKDNANIGKRDAVVSGVLKHVSLRGKGENNED